MTSTTAWIRPLTEAPAGLPDVAGLLQLDVPRLALDERVRVVECQPLARRMDLDEMRGRRRVLANQRIGRGRLHEPREIVGG